ncbi:MAG: glycosyltransferase family 39 protein [Patescibacteria group bacterium]
MKLTNKKIVFILSFIVLIAAILRLWHLNSVPPSLDWDEASWGYNSYSILMTGRDEYGKLMPLVVRSFNDYKPALYAYLDLPFIAVLGLTDLAVRLPNAIFGIFTVLTAYLLVKEMFKRWDLALLSAFLLAISPWSIQFSRFAHEGMVGLEFNLLMILFFLKGLKKPWYLSLSAAAGAISLYSYQNEKLFVPLLSIILLIIFGKELLKIPRKYLISAFLVGVFLALPIALYTVTNPNSFTRARSASFLNNPIGVLNTKNYPERNLVNKQNKDIIGYIFDNRRIVYVKDIFGNYISHFDINYLFIKGDMIGRHQPPGMGHLYLIELPFLLLGLFVLLSGRFDRKIKALLILWMLIVPVPASLTWDVPNAGRTMNFLPTFQILTALGVISAYSYSLKWKKYIRYPVYGAFMTLVLFNFVYYLNQYFVQYSYFSSQAWQYGYNQIIPEVKSLYPKYSKIIVSNESPLDQSYIFFLYNLKYPPKDYQKRGHNFDKYDFKPVTQKDWENSDSTTLFISSQNDFPNDAKYKILKKIYLLNGTNEILIVEGK